MRWNRRQFLVNGIGLTATIGLGGYTYFSRTPAKPTINVNFAGMELGHAIREHAFSKDEPNIVPIEMDTIIVGSGVAAISAAWQLKKQGHSQFLLLNGPERSGNSRSGHYESLNYPTGAHYLAEPTKESTHIHEMLKDLGLLKDGQYDEMAIVHAPSERLFRNNKWQSELLPELDKDGERFFAQIQEFQHSYGNDGKRAFVIPIVLSSQDEAFTQLNQVTFSTWLKEQGYESESLLWYLNYCCLDDYGQGIDEVSAWAGIQYFAARTHAQDSNQLLTWDGGLGTLVEKLRDWIGFEKLTNFPQELAENYCYEMDGSALAIDEQDDHVIVDVLLNRERYRIKAKHVICATPIYITQYIVKNFERYGFDAKRDLPNYAPWLIGNFVLNGFPKEDVSYPLAWDNVVYQGPTLGYINSTHQHISMAMPEKTVFTSYRVLENKTPNEMRDWLRYQVTKDELMMLATEDLEKLYGREFVNRIVHADLTVRGHAMASPTPGFLQNQGLLNLRNHRSRLLFAHSDLSGYSIFEEASWWGIQAANGIIDYKEDVPMNNKYYAFIKFLFDRDETLGTDWQFDLETDEELDRLNLSIDEEIIFIGQMLSQYSKDLAHYSDWQIAHGIEYLFNYAMSDYGREICNGDTSIEHRVAIIQALKIFYKECYNERCARVLLHIDEPGSNPLNSFCYMFGDASAVTWNDDYPKEINDAILELMEFIMGLDNVACLESGLHWIGHVYSDQYKQKAQKIAEKFIAQYEKQSDINGELMSYAHCAAVSHVL